MTKFIKQTRIYNNENFHFNNKSDSIIGSDFNYYLTKREDLNFGKNVTIKLYNCSNKSHIKDIYFKFSLPNYLKSQTLKRKINKSDNPEYIIARTFDLFWIKKFEINIIKSCVLSRGKERDKNYKILDSFDPSFTQFYHSHFNLVKSKKKKYHTEYTIKFPFYYINNEKLYPKLNNIPYYLNITFEKFDNLICMYENIGYTEPKYIQAKQVSKAFLDNIDDYSLNLITNPNIIVEYI